MTARTKILFTQKMVNEWPLDRDGYSSDAKADGLVLRVQNKRKTSVISYRTQDDRQRQVTLDGGLKLDKARDHAAELRLAAKRGNDPLAQRRAAKRKREEQQRSKLGNIINAYLANAATTMKPKTRKAPELYLDREWRPSRA